MMESIDLTNKWSENRCTHNIAYLAITASFSIGEILHDESEIFQSSICEWIMWLFDNE